MVLLRHQQAIYGAAAKEVFKYVTVTLVQNNSQSVSLRQRNAAFC